jgi:SAM-dependent methyltransferase
MPYQLLGALMRGIGATSDSIKLGLTRGFDSGEMMDRIYANRASGRFGFGKIIDRVYLNQVGCQGLRRRKTLLKSTLNALVDDVKTARRPVFIVDIAAGPGTYLVELLAETSTPIRALCRDLDANGLARGRALAAERGVARHIDYAQADALDAQSMMRLAPRPDIVVASGFYELLNDDALIKRSMTLIHGMLQPTRFVFTTQVAHPQLKLIANTLPNRHGELWLMRNRSVATVEAWARAAGFEQVSTTLTAAGMYGVTVCA